MVLDAEVDRHRRRHRDLRPRSGGREAPEDDHGQAPRRRPAHARLPGRRGAGQRRPAAPAHRRRARGRHLHHRQPPPRPGGRHRQRPRRPAGRLGAPRAAPAAPVARAVRAAPAAAPAARRGHRDAGRRHRRSTRRRRRHRRREPDRRRRRRGRVPGLGLHRPTRRSRCSFDGHPIGTINADAERQLRRFDHASRRAPRPGAHLLTVQGSSLRPSTPPSPSRGNLAFTGSSSHTEHVRARRASRRWWSVSSSSSAPAVGAMECAVAGHPTVGCRELRQRPRRTHPAAARHLVVQHLRRRRARAHRRGRPARGKPRSATRSPRRATRAPSSS